MVAYDYAMNQCAYRVTLPENAVTKITLDQTAVTLPQKGYVQLNATVTPTTPPTRTWFGAPPIPAWPR